MSKFYNISLAEMQDCLKVEKGWKSEVGNPTTKEAVFTYVLKNYPEITIKVYSGIPMESGVSRSVGKDAIRVCAVNTKRNCGWIKSARVYRVEGWRQNLKDRVMQVINDAEFRFSRPF